MSDFSRAMFVGFLLLCGAAFAEDAVSPRPPQSLPRSESKTTPATDVYKLSADAQKFKFKKVDLDLLRQLNAFDKYIEDKGWIYDDPLADEYVNRVGRSVVPPNTLENVTWRFRVIRDPVPNAFALPNGSVYIHSGLLSRLENEAQLAGVLAHETTHVFNRHTYLEYHDMRTKAVAIDLIGAGSQVAGFAGANAYILNAVANTIPVMLAATFYGYSRELEEEADSYAVRVIQHAGYDPGGVARALELLTKGPEVDLSKHPIFWADHPKLEKRVRDTTKLAQQFADGGSPGKLGEAEYLTATQNAISHDAHLAMMLGRPRTAVVIGKRLLALQPNSADYHALLGDGYRSLGARTPEPTKQELTNDGKDEARSMVKKLTLSEYEKALLQAPGGNLQWKANSVEAERSFRKALELDSANRSALRGLGFLYQQDNRPADAVANFQRYLEVASGAEDARQIRTRIEVLQKSLAPAQADKP